MNPVGVVHLLQMIRGGLPIDGGVHKVDGQLHLLYRNKEMVLSTVRGNVAVSPNV